MKKLVVYNHGKDSTPWGEKTLALAQVAEQHGYAVDSPDYRQQPDPDERVRQLLSMDLNNYDRIVMIGSSMGGYVATVAAPYLRPRGLFLLAPAFYLPGYRQMEFDPPAAHTLVFHGWNDDIVPPENSWKFCRQHRIRLTMVDSDHRLLGVMPFLQDELDRFLSSLG